MMLWGNTLREHTPTREASYTEAEWLLRIVEAVGDLASEHNRGAGAGVDAAVDRLILMLATWRRERES